MNDFKKFILRGNVVDLAVGIVIGSAFTATVNALVKDIITPLVSTLYRSGSLQSNYFTVHGSRFLYGDLINAVITFFLVALAVFFLVVQPINKMTELRRHKKSDPETATKICPECLSSIPHEARRCMYCTTRFTKDED